MLIEPGMSVQDALTAMAAIESQRSRIGDHGADVLAVRLLTDPGSFWERFFQMLNPISPATVAMAVEIGLDASFNDLIDALASE